LRMWRCFTPSRIWYTTSRAFSSGRGSVAITRNSSPPVALGGKETGHCKSRSSACNKFQEVEV
jgi:hypothetical protein